jgi:sugar phosphate permease
MSDDADRRRLIVLGSMYAGYGAMMVCRQMVTILSPAMLADPALHLTNTNIGDFAAYGTIGALAGKLVWGPLGDRIGGRPTFLLGLFLSALLVAAYGLSPNVLVFTAFSFLLYGAKSGGWPGMTKLVGDWYPPRLYGRVWGVLSTSSRASVVAGTLFFGWLLSRLPWRGVAFAAAGIALLFLAAARWGLAGEPPPPDESAPGAAPDGASHPLHGTTLAEGLRAFARSRRVRLIVVMMMALTCLMAFLDFVPVYLMEVFHLTPSRAAMASSIFPVGSLAGLLAAVALYNRFSRRTLAVVLTGSLAAATACVAGLQLLPGFHLGAGVAFPVVLAAILVFAFMISPAYYIPMSIFSIEFGGPHSATLVCLLDACGFGASAAFGFAGGRLADGPGGWPSFMRLLLFLSVAGAASVWFFMDGERRAAVPAD